MIESGQIKMISKLLNETNKKKRLQIRLQFIQGGDGRLGYPEDAPYDAIHVGAAADSIPDAVINSFFKSLNA